jgi:hypothetical protein
MVTRDRFSVEPTHRLMAEPWLPFRQSFLAVVIVSFLPDAWAVSQEIEN